MRLCNVIAMLLRRFVMSDIFAENRDGKPKSPTSRIKIKKV